MIYLCSCSFYLKCNTTPFGIKKILVSKIHGNLNKVFLLNQHLLRLNQQIQLYFYYKD